jgi:DNA invertase Pin-like site-specific DNA recombinase
VLHLFAALVEKERQLISERTRAGLAAARERGAKLGTGAARQAGSSLRQPERHPPLEGEG